MQHAAESPAPLLLFASQCDALPPRQTGVPGALRHVLAALAQAQSVPHLHWGPQPQVLSLAAAGA